MRKRGFTLIELLVVISIIALLSSVVLASLNTAREKGRLAAGKRFFASLENIAGEQALGMWDFDECTGSTTRDRSGARNDGTFVGGISWSSDSPVIAGCSLQFNGTDAWLNIPQQPAIQNAPNYFTVAGMINPDVQSTRFITPQSHGVDQWIGYDASNSRIDVQITEIADVNNRTKPSTNGSVPANKWTHFAVSINNKNIKIYINGALNAEYTETIDIGTWLGQWVVGQRGINTDWFRGKLDNLRVYGTVLGASEVQGLYAEAAQAHGLAVE